MLAPCYSSIQCKSNNYHPLYPGSLRVKMSKKYFVFENF